jgi:hypothetical protein
MNSRYYNQSIHKYVNGEPHSHLIAKYMVATMASHHNYLAKMEVKTDTFQGYTTDLELSNDSIGDYVGVNVDGAYHQANKKQIGKTNTRDYILQRYYKFRNQRYAVVTVEEVQMMSVDYILRKIGIKQETIN